MDIGTWLAKLRAAAASPPSAQPLEDAAERAVQKAQALTGGRGVFSVDRRANGAFIQVRGARSARALRRTLPAEVEAAKAEIRDDARRKLS